MLTLGRIDIRLPEIEPRTLGKAALRTMNKVAPQGRTEGSKEVRKRYTLKAGDIRKATRIQRATPLRPRAAIVVSGSGLGLIHYRAKWSRRKPGASVMVTKGKRVIIPETFIAAPKGGRNVWRRKGKARLPIKRLTGPSVTQLFGSEDVIKSIRRKISEAWNRVFDHALEFEINKVALRAAR